MASISEKVPVLSGTQSTNDDEYIIQQIGSDQYIVHGSAAVEPETKPTIPGYTPGSSWDKPFVSITEPTDVTCDYTLNSYTVTFKNYDGTVLATRTVDYGTPYAGVKRPDDPSREGYKFTGWGDPDPSSAISSDGKVIGDCVITAQFKLIQSITICTVTLNPTEYKLYYDTWTPDPIKPTVTVTDQYGNILVENVDYTVAFANNTIYRTFPYLTKDDCLISMVGRTTKKTANATIVGIGAWKDSTVKTFTISYTDNNTPCVFGRDQNSPTKYAGITYILDYELPGTIKFHDGEASGTDYPIWKGVNVNNTYGGKGTKYFTVTDANGQTYKGSVILSDV